MIKRSIATCLLLSWALSACEFEACSFSCSEGCANVKSNISFASIGQQLKSFRSHALLLGFRSPLVKNEIKEDPIPKNYSTLFSHMLAFLEQTKRDETEMETCLEAKIAHLTNSLQSTKTASESAKILSLIGAAKKEMAAGRRRFQQVRRNLAETKKQLDPLYLALYKDCKQAHQNPGAMLQLSLIHFINARPEEGEQALLDWLEWVFIEILDRQDRKQFLEVVGQLDRLKSETGSDLHSILDLARSALEKVAETLYTRDEQFLKQITLKAQLSPEDSNRLYETSLKLEECDAFCE